MLQVYRGNFESTYIELEFLNYKKTTKMDDYDISDVICFHTFLEF